MIILTRRKGLKLLSRRTSLVSKQMHLTENKIRILIGYYRDILFLADKDMEKSFGCFDTVGASVHSHRKSIIEDRLS